MTDTTYSAFFGDRVRTFRLTYPLVLELERNVGRVGFGALCQKMFHSEFGIVEISETIRLGLIGGGENPERAAELVATYVHGRPLTEVYLLAVNILQATWFGTKQNEAPNDQS